MIDPLLIHGGALDEMERIFPDAPRPWLGLSTGINPWPYPVHDIPDTVFHELPTQNAFLQCRAAMAEAFGAPPNSVLPVPGSELAIRLLPSLLQGKRIAIAKPTYGDHVRVWAAAGRSVFECEDPLEHIGDADIAVLCNPDNPDGRVWSVDRLEAARADLAERGGWLVVDEAFGELAPECSMSRYGGNGGLVVLRSFGKFYGLPGTRLGALIAPPSVIDGAKEGLGYWSVSGPALWLGAQAYGDRPWRKAMSARLAAARCDLDDRLRAAGLHVAGGTDLFRFITVRNAESVWRVLAERGIYIRRFDWSETHLRIGLPGSTAHADRLSKALTRL